MTKRQCWNIWILSVFGALSVLPYIYFLGIIPEGTSGIAIFFKSIFNASIIYGIICWLSYLLLKHVDLDPFQTVSKKNIFLAIFSGLSVGFVIVLSNKILFRHSMLAVAAHPPFWAGILASLYGSINEEVLCRLFLLTLIYFILSMFFRCKEAHKPYLMWTSIVLVAFIFGAGHLPAVFSLGAASGFEIFRVLFLNGIAGIIFGWLYCYRVFWLAVIAHFVADITIHALFIF